MSSFSFDKAFDMTGKVVLVTGGAAGIGQAVATVFAERGARLALADLSPAVAETAAGLPGKGHFSIAADISVPGEPDRVVAAVLKELGQIDVLVNNAGVGLLESAEKMTDEMWDRTIAVNLTAPFRMARAAFPALRKSGAGRIVNIASQAAVIALDKHVAYCSSKAGVLGLTNVLAAEWAQYGISVAAISPTVVETELGRRAWAGEVGVAMKKKIPAGRFAQPEEIALAALYLASGASAMITGANLIIDGGYTIV
jgi:2-deoxy-D-gluconate 3-dehydrogenase